MYTITKSQMEAIRVAVYSHDLGVGMSQDPDVACSVASINLALSGQLTDDIPECMSIVAGGMAMYIQDKLPYAMRNSTQWRDMLPYLAGSGQDAKREAERTQLVVERVWSLVPLFQEIAEQWNAGDEWKRMSETKSLEDIQACYEIFDRMASEPDRWYRDSVWALKNVAESLETSSSWSDEGRLLFWTASAARVVTIAGQVAGWDKVGVFELIEELIQP